MRGPAVTAMAQAGDTAAGIAHRFVDRYVGPRAVRSLVSASPGASRPFAGGSAEFAARLVSDRRVGMRLGGLRRQARGLIGEIARSAEAKAAQSPVATGTARRGVRPPGQRLFRPFLDQAVTGFGPSAADPASRRFTRPVPAPPFPVVPQAAPALPSAKPLLAEAPDASPQMRARRPLLPLATMSVLEPVTVRPRTPFEAGPVPPADAMRRDFRRLAPTALRDTLRRQGGPGALLDAALRERLRGPLRFDPAEARLHRGAAAAAASRALGAQAFTIGRDVFFGEGRYEPDSSAGLELLAHELTHVGQQSRMVRDQMRFFTAGGGDALEEEAQQTAARVRDMTPMRPGEAAKPTAREIDRPPMQLARFNDGPATFGEETVVAHAPASPVGMGAHGAMPSTRTITDHVYDLMKRELAQSSRRGQTYRKG